MGKPVIKEFPEEFILECRMMMDDINFDFWFGVDEDVAIIGYISRKCAGLRPDYKAYLKYDDEEYILFYTMTTSDGIEHYWSDANVDGFFKEMSKEDVNKYKEMMEVE